MAQVLRQSTQVVVVIGPFVDVTDGFTPETGITLGAADEAEILKANTTTTTDISGATWAAITGCDGWYGLTLTTSHTDTVGALTVMVNDDSVCLPVFARFQVIEEAAYDTIYAASALPASTTNITAGTITTATNVTTVNGLAANVITATSIAADAITAAKVAADVAAEIADAVWDEDATAHQTGGTFGQAIGDPGADTNTIFKAVVTDATGATVGVDVVAVKADTAAILADTGTDGVVVAAGSKTGYSLTATTGLGNQTADITGNLSGSVGSVTGAVGSVTGAVGSVTAAVTVGAVNAAGLADFFDTNSGTTYASAVAGSVVKEIADNAGGGTPPTAAQIADAVWDEAQADHVGVGTFGVIASEIADILVDTGTTLQGELDGIQADTEDIQARLPAALTADGNIKADTLRVGGTLQTAGDIIGDTNDIQTKIGTPAGASVSADIAAVKVDTAAILVDTGTTLDGKIDTIDTVVDAIKAKTDSLTFTLAGHVDANVQRINDVAITGDGSAGDKFDVV